MGTLQGLIIMFLNIGTPNNHHFPLNYIKHLRVYYYLIFFFKNGASLKWLWHCIISHILPTFCQGRQLPWLPLALLRQRSPSKMGSLLLKERIYSSRSKFLLTVSVTSLEFMVFYTTVIYQYLTMQLICISKIKQKKSSSKMQYKRSNNIGRLRKSGGQKIDLIPLLLHEFSWNFAYLYPFPIRTLARKFGIFLLFSKKLLY